MNINKNIVNLLINNIVTKSSFDIETCIGTSSSFDPSSELSSVSDSGPSFDLKTSSGLGSGSELNSSHNQDIDPIQKLNELHKKLKIKYGDFSEEYPEQEMSVSYIKPDNIVLELGGNIGRNSCIIASLLNNSNNLIVFESDPENAIKLKENCDLNNLNFIIEDCAISKIELLQKNWITKSKDLINDDELLNWKPIKTMSWLQIKNKYKIIFDTLVADCEGALYYILKDEPNFLETFKTIIIENDFNDIEHKHFVDTEFKRFNFNNVYTKSGGFGPCYNCFFEVWTK
jgi:FkbM family methyltransferase